MSALRENFRKSISLILGLFTLLFLLIRLISVDRLFQELIHRLYIHFKPNVVLLYDGMKSLPVVACLVEYSYKSFVLIKVFVNESGRLKKNNHRQISNC